MQDVNLLESEAAAAVGEARAIERETRAETAALAAQADGGGLAGPDLDPGREVGRMETAATALLEAAYRLQNPARPNPYAPLGTQVAALASQVLNAIAGFTPAAAGPGEPPPKP